MSITLFMFQIAIAILLSLCSNDVSQQTRTYNESLHCSGERYYHSYADTTYRIIPSINNTYGYEILVGQKVVIRQQTIPGMPGLMGFKQKQDAEKVARLVIKKMEQGLIPPTIEKKDLEDLKINY